MLFRLVLLAIVGFASAAPTSPLLTDGTGSSVVPRHLELGIDDVVMMGKDGRLQVIKEDKFLALKKSGNFTVRSKDDFVNIDNKTLEARQDCPGRNTEFTITSRSYFLDWDVQVSPVIGAIQAPVTIAIARGHNIANSVAVSAAAGLDLEVFNTELQVEFTRTWTTVDTTTITYTIPVGMWGTVISQPWTHRVYGNVYTSCTTDNWEKYPFMADYHDSETYEGDLNWVTGFFRLCAAKQYPVPYCEGHGVHK